MQATVSAVSPATATAVRGARPTPAAIGFPKSWRREPTAAAAAARGSGGDPADLRIPGATATVARDLLFEGPRRAAAATAPTPSVPPPLPAAPPAAGSWLGPALVGLAVGVAGSWAASAFGKAAMAAAAARATPRPAVPTVAGPTPAAAAAKTAAATAAAPASAAPPPAAPKTRRPPRSAGVAVAMRWYRTRLPRLHYLQAGGAPLPTIAASELGLDVAEALLSGNRGGEVLIAFQDAADAEFALSCMAKGKSSAGAALASATPAQLEGRLGPEQTLFVLPPGRLAIKSVSEAGLKQLLLIALLQDVADRAGAVGPSPVDDARASVSSTTQSKMDDSPASFQQQQVLKQPSAALRRPPSPPATTAAAAAKMAVDKPPATPATPPPPTPPMPTPTPTRPTPASANNEDEDDDEQPFAPVAFPPVEVDERRQQSLLDDYYALEQSWAAERLANVASAAQAQIQSLDSAGGEQVDRSTDEQNGADGADDDDSKSTVVSKGTRTKREGEEAPPTLAPEDLQKSVLQALKEIDPSRDDRDKNLRSDAPARPLIGTGDDEYGDGGSTWWKRRFRVVYLPIVNEPDGVAGFFQVDISADGTAKDVRVVAFEDQYDAMLCGATMQQLGSFGGASCSVAAMSTDKVEGELAEAWRRQKAEGAGASAPSNLLVFRRKKLPLKVGMSEEEFVRCIVYGGAAQQSLLQTGFKF